MNDVQKEAVARLKAQQDGVKKGSAPWMVAEQLMDICRREPASAALILTDLDNPSMSVTTAERKVHDRADEIQKETREHSVGISPTEAEAILRKFYGLPDADEEAQARPVAASGAINVALADFLRG